MTAPFEIVLDAGTPIVAAAIHDGHDLRPDVADLMALDAGARRREEDPYTARWTAVAGTRLVGRRSRFEVDLNRPREGAVYRVPGDAWGLDVWRRPPDDALVAGSLAVYDDFHAAAERALSAVRERWGRFVVLDLHSYNHRRDGADAPAADPAANPEVNVGTGTLDRARWGPLVDRFCDDLRRAGVDGRPLDVRENVRFRGGHFAAWVHERFPDSGCALAIEFRKDFMDEWTGAPDEARIAALGRALGATVPGLRASLDALASLDAPGAAR